MGEEKGQELVDHWNDQVYDWLERQLGATHIENVCTDAIAKSVQDMLASEATGKSQRDMYKVKLLDVEIPADVDRSCAVKDLEGKLGYVRCLYGDEDITSAFPRDRISTFGI